MPAAGSATACTTRRCARACASCSGTAARRERRAGRLCARRRSASSPPSADDASRIVLAAAPARARRSTSPRRACSTRDPGHARYTTSHNVRKLLEAHELLGEPLAPAYARALLRIAKHETLEAGSTSCPHAHRSHAAASRSSRTLQSLHRRRATGGRAARARPARHARVRGADLVDDRAPRPRRVPPEEQRRRHRRQPRQARRPGGEGGAHSRPRAPRPRGARRSPARALSRADRRTAWRSAEVVDHVFRWETDFAFPWMEGWAKNQDTPRRAQHRDDDPRPASRRRP